ncbi:electron transfer flavoprotein subunit beta [Chromobacterium alkanivorans]|uniref:electron transfer flavoprotein subunit beta n=1 Tax=Chromobacterium alkanivorans TaxID=1071719 RepID=UPI001967055A|nr:electron transfer flavoprotein subunit beta [Chromobacterium alkanivorans]MBN3006502.1 electron transfer flavoprotein subunit beta [Chromobacterium alkanivorans]
MNQTVFAAGAEAKTAVLVAPAAHPVSGRPCAGAGDLAALALARRLGRAFVVLHAGAADKDALADYLAQGAAAITVLDLPADSDPTPALIAALGGFELILCGERSGGGEASALLPYLLAEGLDRPLLPGVLELSEADGEWRALQGLAKGRRRRLAAQAPLLASVKPDGAEPRWSWAGLQRGVLTRRTAAGAPMPAPRLEPARRARALAAQRGSGLERLLGAIAGEAAGGGRVVKQGDSVEKAQAVLDYLRQHQLVDF